jgi:arylsulfatase A-like enzyme
MIQPMNKKLLLSLSLFGISASALAKPAPNIVLMLADDLGWQDVKCYDVDEPSPMETPHIDTLAKRGVLFRNGYSPAPTCAPSRCAIMSGIHPARAQKTHVVGGDPPNAGASTPLITPWYSGRMPADELTLAKILRQNGYATGHAGKWHMAKDHFSFPGPLDQGFEFTTHRTDCDARGVQTGMQNRLEGFATSNAGDPYQLDADGFPTDPVTKGALEFMARNTSKPIFLYYATWLVHSPIQSRSKALLEKYCAKLGVDYPTNPEGWELEGQKNPYYCAMVETLDHYVGKLVGFLETTDDPRNPGHKLIDNTFIFFTSDNGGMEGHPGEIITDNAPLDKGKMSAKEGGVRVPFLVAGPGIRAGLQSDVVVNGLDFYPTILSMAGIKRPGTKALDGPDLFPLLTRDPQDGSLVRGPDGKPRKEMVWHYPHGGVTGFQSTLLLGNFKLIRNYIHEGSRTPRFELYQLGETKEAGTVRKDWEEKQNLAAEMPEKVAEMDRRLTRILDEMRASYPYLNPDFKRPFQGSKQVPTVTECTMKEGRLKARFKENGSKVVRADLIYATGGGTIAEEWFRAPAEIGNDGQVLAAVPAGATHCYLNLVDENNFLVSHPRPVQQPSGPRKIASFSGTAIPVTPHP